MTTVKIKPTHPSQGEFVVIERVDFDPARHELCDGESLGGTSGDTGDGAPTLAELIASRNQLLARSDELDDRELALNKRANTLDGREHDLAAREAAVSEREQANQIEAQRLATLAASAGSTDPASMSKDELHAALDAKGVKYPAAANKAELIALLAGA